MCFCRMWKDLRSLGLFGTIRTDLSQSQAAVGTRLHWSLKTVHVAGFWLVGAPEEASAHIVAITHWLASGGRKAVRAGEVHALLRGHESVAVRIEDDLLARDAT